MNERSENVAVSTDDEVMPKRTLKALQESIAKWERLTVEGLVSENASDDCPLCKLFYPENRSDWDGKKKLDCRGCPIDKLTNGAGCVGTPCCKFFDAQERGDEEAMRLHAKHEAEFLRSFLPKDVTP